MQIMCLNGWGGKLHAGLTSYLRDASPDVLCLQEVVHTPGAQKEWLTYRDGDHVLPQRANFFRDVCAALPDHVAIFCPAAQGVLWDGDRAVASQWGLATFVRSGFPVIGQAQDFVHKDFSAQGYGAHPRSRSAHAVRIFDFDRGLPVTIAHMHGLRDLRGKIDTPERLDQAGKFEAPARGVARPDERLVLCGDFNVEPDSETLAYLHGTGLRELVAASGTTGTRSSHYT